MNLRQKYEQVMWSCGLWPLTLRMAGLKLWASLRSELRSCWKPCSSAGEAAVGELCWDATCCSRHTLVRVTNNRSHSSNCTSYSTDRNKSDNLFHSKTKALRYFTLNAQIPSVWHSKKTTCLNKEQFNVYKLCVDICLISLRLGAAKHPPPFVF